VEIVSAITPLSPIGRNGLMASQQRECLPWKGSIVSCIFDLSIYYIFMFKAISVRQKEVRKKRKENVRNKMRKMNSKS
jgi:hypothetical protein